MAISHWYTPQSLSWLGSFLVPQAWRDCSRMKHGIAITRRNRGVSLDRVISELNSLITGWVTYFRLAACQSYLKRIDEWIRRKVRCYWLKQLKRRWTTIKFLKSLDAVTTASSGKGWWRLSQTPALHKAMNNAYMKKLRLKSLLKRYEMFRGSETAGCDIARPVV